MQNKHSAVIGLGFGDEGKGLVTNYLCLQNPKALVVRYSGGQQAGHTVVKDDVRHIFSNFGSGSLNGNPTYWSEYCTVDPVGIYNEFQVLIKKGYRSALYINAKCPVTTPMDKFANKTAAMADGTCGVGVGSTKQREENFYSLLYEDLFYPSILEIKLDLIKKYYQIFDVDLTAFYLCVDKIQSYSNIHMCHHLPSDYDYIYESSQGLLLDQNYGFFPHVTRSSVGIDRVHDINFMSGGSLHTYYVTRAYQTRHGNGPMTNQDLAITPMKYGDLSLDLINNILETNVNNEFQGVFRKSILDLDLIEYALMKEDPDYENSTLVITCLDQLCQYYFTYKGEIIESETKTEFVNKISQILSFDNILISESDKSENIKKFV